MGRMQRLVALEDQYNKSRESVKRVRVDFLGFFGEFCESLQRVSGKI
jgi:hypothetical protein